MFGFIKNWWYYNEYALLKQEYEKLLNDFDDYITMYEEVLGKNKKLEEDN